MTNKKCEELLTLAGKERVVTPTKKANDAFFAVLRSCIGITTKSRKGFMRILHVYELALGPHWRYVMDHIYWLLYADIIGNNGVHYYKDFATALRCATKRKYFSSELLSTLDTCRQGKRVQEYTWVGPRYSIQSVEDSKASYLNAEIKAVQFLDTLP